MRNTAIMCYADGRWWRGTASLLLWTYTWCLYTGESEILNYRVCTNAHTFAAILMVSRIHLGHRMIGMKSEQ